MVLLEPKKKRKISLDGKPCLTSSESDKTASIRSSTEFSLNEFIQIPSQIPIKNEIIVVSKSHDSRLEFETIKSSNVLFYFYKILVKIPVNETNGVIVGTETKLESLFNPFILNQEQETQSMAVLKTQKECIVFFVNEEDKDINDLLSCLTGEESTFTVNVHSSTNFKRMKMQGITEPLWNALKQVVKCSSVMFQQIVNASHKLLPDSYQGNGLKSEETKGIITKNVLITLDISQQINQLSNVFEDFDFMQVIPLEDQIILLKENIFSVDIVFNLHVHDQERNHKTRSALDRHLVVGIQWKKFERTGQYPRLYQAILDNLFPVIRLDPFVMSLVMIILFLTDRPELTAVQEIRDERLKYIQLLDSYFKAKITSDQWASFSYQEAWDSISMMIPIIQEITQNLITFVKKNPFHQ